MSDTQEQDHHYKYNITATKSNSTKLIKLYAIHATQQNMLVIPTSLDVCTTPDYINCFEYQIFIFDNVKCSWLYHGTLK